MNEKKEKRYKIAIIILAACFCISTGVAVYYGRSASADYAEQLRATIGRLESTITELSGVNDKQGEQLAHILDELRAATDLVGELGDIRGRAADLVRSANEGLIELERAMAAGAGTFDAVIERQQRIDAAFRRVWNDNRRLREALDDSDAGR